MSNCSRVEYSTFRIGDVLFLGKIVVQLCNLLCATYVLGKLALCDESVCAGDIDDIVLLLASHSDLTTPESLFVSSFLGCSWLLLRFCWTYKPSPAELFGGYLGSCSSYLDWLLLLRFWTNKPTGSPELFGGCLRCDDFCWTVSQELLVGRAFFRATRPS